MFTCSKTAGLDGLAGAQQQNQSCIKLCVPMICSSRQHWTRRFFWRRPWLVNNWYYTQNIHMHRKWRKKSQRTQQDKKRVITKSEIVIHSGAKDKKNKTMYIVFWVIYYKVGSPLTTKYKITLWPHSYKLRTQYESGRTCFLLLLSPAKQFVLWMR